MIKHIRVRTSTVINITATRLLMRLKKRKKNFYNERVKIGNTKQWWKNVKPICNLKRPTGFTLFNKESNEPLSNGQMAEMINSFFSNLTAKYPPVSQAWFASGLNLPLPHVSEELIIHRLKNINQNKAPGPFDPPLKMIKSVAELLGPVMSNIMNSSFLTKEFPNLWKYMISVRFQKLSHCHQRKLYGQLLSQVFFPKFRSPLQLS